MKAFLLSTLVATIILFLWSGLTQVLPWGITTTQNISVQTGKPLQAPNMLLLEPDVLTTEAFDGQFVNKISTYTTDETHSWIVTQPLQTNYTGYFVIELITQLIVALFLSAILLLTVRLELLTRLVIIGLAALAASTATYGQLMNWWSIPASYALGVSFNILIAWLLAAFVSAQFIIKSDRVAT